MTEKTSEYRRLPGKKKGFLIGHYTLWQGSDHLLQIYSRLGVEDYKRFYFNDIQAIITRKSVAGKFQNIALGVLSGLFCLFAVASGGGWSLFHAIIAAALLLILLINVIKGPTCETVLQTAVQTEKIPSLYRLKATQPVMNHLRSIVERHQGRVDAATFDQQLAALAAHRPRRLPAGTDTLSLKTQNHERGRMHLWLFLFLILDGLIVTAGFMFTHVSLTLLGSAVTMLLGIFVVVALVKQHESNLKRPLRSITWAALGYVCFSFIAGYVISMGIAFRHPEIMRNQWELFKLLSKTTPWESPLVMTVNIIALSAAAIIGIAGLFMLKNPQQPIYQPSAVPTPPIHTAAAKRMP
jgi:hypothetical protein